MQDSTYHDKFEPVTRDESFDQFFPDGLPDDPRTTPLSAAWFWWGALVNGDMEMVRALSYNPNDWGGYAETRATVESLALAQYIHPSEEVDDIAYMKLIRDPGFYAKVKDPGFEFTDGSWLTLVKESGGWYVWGISDASYRPDAQRVEVS